MSEPIDPVCERLVARQVSAAQQVAGASSFLAQSLDRRAALAGAESAIVVAHARARDQHIVQELVELAPEVGRGRLSPAPPRKCT
jgi:hypothetical protein